MNEMDINRISYTKNPDPYSNYFRYFKGYTYGILYNMPFQDNFGYYHNSAIDR